MEGIIRIIKTDSDLSMIDTYDLSLTYDQFGYEVSIESDLTTPFEDFTDENRRQEFLYAIKEQVDFLKSFDEDENTKKFYALIARHRGREMDLLKNAKYVSFGEDFEIEDVASYLATNGSFREKTIVFHWDIDMGTEALDDIERLFVGFDYRFELEGNMSLVTIDECRKTIEIIENTVARIARLGLSPSEQAMFAYDLVRDQEYVQEGIGEEAWLSRDLTSVLLGDKIVCVGYANKLHHILKGLGIKSRMYNLKKSDGTGHEILIALIEDDKYGINGIYYFDPTADRKKDGTRNFLYSYRFFAKTKDQMEKEHAWKYFDPTFGDFSLEFIRSFEEEVKTRGIQGVDDRTINCINEIAKFIDGKRLIPNKRLLTGDLPVGLCKPFSLEDTMNTLYRYLELFSRPFDIEKFERIVFDVRKMEYYEEPGSYPFDLLTMVNILHNSGIEIEESDEEKLLKAILGKAPKNAKARKYIECIKDAGLDRDVYRIQVTRLLRTRLESLQTNEIDNKKIK